MTKRPEAEPILQPTLFEFQKPSELTSVDRPFSLPNIFLGTSSFTAAGWEGSFYPLGMRSKDFLCHYSRQFQTVEIDSTFYGTPAASTVTSWNEKTPPDFVFALKVPQVITHEKGFSSWLNQMVERYFSCTRPSLRNHSEHSQTDY